MEFKITRKLIPLSSRNILSVQEYAVKTSVLNSEFFEMNNVNMNFMFVFTFTLFLAECDFNIKMKFPSEVIVEQ